MSPDSPRALVQLKAGNAGAASPKAAGPGAGLGSDWFSDGVARGKRVEKSWKQGRMLSWVWAAFFEVLVFSNSRGICKLSQFFCVFIFFLPIRAFWLCFVSRLLQMGRSNLSLRVCKQQCSLISLLIEAVINRLCAVFLCSCGE